MAIEQGSCLSLFYHVSAASGLRGGGLYWIAWRLHIFKVNCQSKKANDTYRLVDNSAFPF